MHFKVWLHVCFVMLADQKNEEKNEINSENKSRTKSRAGNKATYVKGKELI